MDTADKKISGWAFDTQKSDVPVVIEIYSEKGLIGETTANLFRHDLKEKGIHPTGECGFAIESDQLALNDVYKIRTIEKDSRVELNNSPQYYKKNIRFPKVFFMHIAKTAGTSFNEYIKNFLEPEDYLLHFESKVREGDIDPAILCQKKYISAHINIHHVSSIFNLEDYKKLTLLREPVSHLLSHLTWVRSISDDTNSVFFKEHPNHIKELSLQLKAINFNSKKEIQLFIENIDSTALVLFDNCQIRYLRNDYNKYVNEDSLNAAISVLSRFDLVGITEQYYRFLELMCLSFSLPFISQSTRYNVKTKVSDLSSQNNVLVAALSPLYEKDQKLYNHAKTIFDNQVKNKD